MWKSILVDWSKFDDDTKAKIAAACLSGDNLDKMALAEPDNTLLCVQIAKNPHTMPLTMAFLASKGTIYVRELVAASERTPVETLEELAHDESSAVRSAVRKNPNTPEEVVREMIKNITA